MALYVVATPIGNLEDISARAGRTLKECAAVLAEDTRRTQGLLAHLGLRRPLARYDDHVHQRESSRLLARLKAGENLALVTDAGTPGVSDPGGRLAAEAAAQGIPVIPIPGPSAALTALMGSGLPMESFTFLGFLSRRAGRIQRELAEAGAARTLVLFESPYRVVETLALARDVFGDVPAAVGRELTKVHEEFVRGVLSAVEKDLSGRGSLKGEFTVVIAPQLKTEVAA
jgi:16S rRNA (cytidine1402-2'-O)-methyltransferase